MTSPQTPPKPTLRRSRIRVSQFAVVPAAVVLDRSLTPAQKTMMQVVCLHANRDGWCWAKFETMAEELGVEVPQVSKMVSALVTAGYLERHYKTIEARRRVALRVVYDRPIATLEEVDAEDLTEGSVSTKESLDENVTFQEGKSAAAEFPTGKPRVSTTESRFYEQTKEQELPTPSARGALDEKVGLAAEFEDPAHRAVYLELRARHRLPIAFDATLRKIRTPITGGVPYSWAEIGAGLLSQAGNGETFNELRLRGYCRTQRESAGAAAGAGGRAPADAAGVLVGSTRLAPQRFWDLCVETGLTARGQSSSALDGRVERFAQQGGIADAAALKALVLHVEPWTLAAITFAPERLGKLRERFASYVQAHPEAA